MSEEERFNFPLKVDKSKWDLRAVVQIILREEKYTFQEIQEIRQKISKVLGDICKLPEVIVVSHTLNL